MSAQLEKYPVKGWEGLYEIDKLGNIFSLPKTITYVDGRTFTYKYRSRKSVLSGNGYHMMFLSDGNSKECVYVHRLLALTFLGDPVGSKNHVNHKNGVKTDNRLENLEWVTRSENMQHRYDVLKNKAAALGKFGALNCGSKAIIGTSMDGLGTTIEFAALQEAARNGFSAGNICMCISGERKYHKGFTWKFSAKNQASQRRLGA
jgi:hypothetical protein